MPRFFTHYWRNRTVDYQEPGQLLDYLAGNQLVVRGVTRGDHVYAVTVRSGELYLLAKMVVDEIVSSVDEAAERLGLEASDLWDAEDCVLGAAATPVRLDQRVAVDTTAVLRFKSGTREQPLVFQRPGYLDNQTLRGVRELTPASAALLDTLLEPLETIVPQPFRQPTADSEELDRRVARLRARGLVERPRGQLHPQRVVSSSQQMSYARLPEVKGPVPTFVPPATLSGSV